MTLVCPLSLLLWLYSLRLKLYVALEKKIVANYMSLYITNATLMLLFLL